MSKKATIIAVVNQKGGTGKTTTTENLGVGLALEGKKVLLVDTDPQASLTVSLGNPCPDDLSPTLSDLMGKIMMENPITPDEGILHHPEGVDLVPSNIELSGMEVALVNAMSRETILRQYLDTVKQNYDYILLDCMPSLGINRAFNKLIEEKGLPKVVFHSLRHSSITYKLKLNGGDMKSVQGDSGHAQVKMVADVYSHIIDDDRRLNAERMEAAFYSGRQATPEPVQPAATESSADDKELLLKLLQNPEMAALLKSLAKTL